MNNRKKYMMLRGSYTVEASFLSVILLSVLLAIIYLGFYMHDRGFMQGAAHEAACSACLHAGDDTSPASTVAKRLVSGRLLFAGNISTQVSDDGKYVTVKYTGQTKLFGMISPFFGGKDLHLQSQVKLTTRRPSVTIQKIRGAVKVFNRIRGE